jgi:hypothetical protein
MQGHRGAILLQREVEGEVEFVALTLWDRMETIEQFTGKDPNVAIVEPEGRAALERFDHFATHFTVVASTGIAGE